LDLIIPLCRMENVPRRNPWDVPERCRAKVDN
jgi:hypothetical protein